MASLDSFTTVEAYNNQVEIPGIASIINEDVINQATYGNHCELSSTTILAVYNDVTNLKGMVRIGTRVSDFAIEWGTEVSFNTGACSNIIPVRISDTKFLIVFQLSDGSGSNNYGFSICGTVVGTVPTLGTRLVFNSASTTPIGAVLMDTDKVMIAFANSTTNGQAVIASISGTTVSYGTVFTFKATTNITIGGMTLTQLCKHSITLATVVYYVSATVTNSICLVVSGTTITAPSAEVSFGGSANIAYPSIGALSTTSFVIAYTDVTDSGKGKAQVGTISGTTISAGSEYTHNTGNTPTRISRVAVISSTLFAISYQSSVYGLTCLEIIIGGITSSTVIGFGGVVYVAYTSGYHYPPALSNTILNITYTKSGQLTFSYFTQYLNQFVCGMLTQNYKTAYILSMCYIVAIAGATEQIEISSLYLKSNPRGFGLSTGIGGDFTGSLYLDGTFPNNKFYTTSDTFVSTTALSFIETKRLGMSNEPIILTGGKTLYASIDTEQNASPQRGSCTVFGLKRSV
jgi:hypothetical protein